MVQPSVRYVKRGRYRKWTDSGSWLRHRKLDRASGRGGYDCIGVDLSADMLEIAMEKREQSGHDILYLQQDMREFELYGTVRAVICVCDSLNYIMEEEDLLQVFRLVNNYFRSRRAVSVRPEYTL